MSLTIKELCVDLQKTRILKNINLEIRTGEFVSLLGASGCGKTTLTRLINGLAEQFYEGTMKGRITLLGRSISEYPLYEIGKSNFRRRRHHQTSAKQAPAKHRIPEIRTVSAYDGRTEYQLFDGSEKNPEKR